MTPQDWVLVTLAASEGKSLGPIQLQKTLFIIGKKVPRDSLGEAFFQFVPYDYGPFCSKIYSDAEDLELLGLIQISRSPAVRYKQYLITDAGKKRALESLASLPKNVKKFIQELVPAFSGASFNQLVEAVYRSYPETKMNSIYREPKQ